MIVPDGYTTIDQPALSEEWELWMFGSKAPNGFIYTPLKGHNPSWLARFFCRWLLNCQWVRKGKR